MFDMTSVLAIIAEGQAAGILVSIALTAAILALRASKLPRRG